MTQKIDPSSPHDQAVEEYFLARPESANPATSGGYGANFLANLSAGAWLGAHPALPPSSWKSVLIEELMALTRTRADQSGEPETVTIDDVPAAIWGLRDNSRNTASYPAWTRIRWFPNSVGTTLATVRPASHLIDLVDLDDDVDDVLAPPIRDTLVNAGLGVSRQLDRLVAFGPFRFRLRPNKELGGRQLLWFTEEASALGLCAPTQPCRPATTLRDALGLVHYRKGDRLALVLFPAAGAPFRPCAFDGVGHRRFMLGTSRPFTSVPPGPWGQAAHLRTLEEETDLAVMVQHGFDGEPERVSQPLSRDDLGDAVLTAQVFEPVDVDRGDSGTDVEFTAYLERTMLGMSSVPWGNDP